LRWTSNKRPQNVLDIFHPFIAPSTANQSTETRPIELDRFYVERGPRNT